MFLSPGFLWFLMLIPPVIYLHLRKRQRSEVEVSSLFLWLHPEGNVETKFRRKFNTNLHLILQILILILLSLTLANPIIPLGLINAERTVIIIDGSASMGVLEKGRSRFDLAISEATSLLRERGGNTTSVILASSKSEIISEFGEATDVQINKLKKLEFFHTSCDIESAILTGNNLIGGYENSEIILISDGAFNSNINYEKPEYYFKFIPVGSQKLNLGITALKSRRDPLISNVNHIYINVHNYTDIDTQTELIFLVNGKEYKNIPIKIPGNGSLSTVEKIGEVSGRLEVVLNTNDQYPLDDRAFMILETGNPVSLLLISDGNLYLESVFSIMDGIELSVNKEQNNILDYDVIVFDKPPEDLKDPGNYIFFGSVPNSYNIDYEGAVDFPGITSWASEHPVFDSVDPASFSVYQAVHTRAGNEFTSILEGEVPLIYTIEENNYKSVYFTFMLNASNLVLKPAFPLLLNNTINWMLPGMEFNSLRTKDTGKIIQQRNVNNDLYNNSLFGELMDSSGELNRLEVKNNRCSFTPYKTGFYKLRVFENEYEYAVNLFSPDESDINRRFSPEELEKVNSQYNTRPFYPTRNLLIIIVLLFMIFELVLTRKRREGSGTIGILQLGLAFVSILFLVLVSLNISLLKEKTESTVIFLLDISRSISRGNIEAALNWINESNPDPEDNINTGLVIFGENSKVLKSPGRDQLDFNLSIFPESEESNLEAGINQAMALFPGRGDNRIVIMTDGNETKGDVLENVRSIGNENIRISGLALSGLSTKNEIIANSIIGVSHASPEENISLTLEIESRQESSGIIYFYLDGEYYGEDNVIIHKGRTMLSYRVNMEKTGYHLFEAVIESKNDNIFENNKFQKMVFIEGSPTVLYVHNGEGPSEMLVEPLKSHGFTFEIIQASTFPDTLTELYSYDSVILDNIPAYYFSSAKMEMIRGAVSAGLGLFVIGGDNSLGAGGYYNTPLEKAIPVDVDIISSLDLPGTALVMVIDNSGSMQDPVSQNERKSDLAKQAVYSALEVLDSGDTAGILAFNADFEWIVKIEPELDLDSVRENLFPLSPGGGTVLLPALEEAFRVLNSTTASVKHILILSDGYADSEGFENLLRDIQRSGITVSTVAVGTDSNKQLMENIAAWGRGRNYYTDDIRSVPSIFVSESLKASRQLFVEETFFPSISQAHEILSDIKESNIPPLHGFMLTYPKSNSEILLKGPGNNPLLSVWQYGIGRSAVFTSNLSSSWASDWYLWESSNLLFSNILRWISKGDPVKGLELSLSRNRSTIYIEVDARNENGEFLNGLKLEGRVILPDLSETKVEINQDSAGFYKGEFPVSINGNYFVTVIDTDSITTDKMQNLNAAFIAVPYSEEYRKIMPSLDLLKSISNITNGDELSLTNPLSSDFYSYKQDTKASDTIYWQLFVLFAFILFIISVFFRLQRPEYIFSPLIKFTALIVNRVSGRPVISYSLFRKKMEVLRREQEKSKYNNSFWFGKEVLKDKDDKIHISDPRKK